MAFSGSMVRRNSRILCKPAASVMFCLLALLHSFHVTPAWVSPPSPQLKARADLCGSQSFSTQLGVRGSSRTAARPATSTLQREDELGCKYPGSTFTAASNLMKNLIGSSMFCLPAALLKGSVMPGLVAMVVVCLASGSSFMLIAYLCDQLNGRTYRDIWDASLGPRTGFIVDACILANGLVVCMLYNILVADLVSSISGAMGLSNIPRSLIVVTNVSIFLAPLCHMRDLSALRYTSITGLCLIFAVFAFLVGEFFGQWHVAKANLVANAFRLDCGIFSTVAICIGAFQAHYNSPTYFKELGCNFKAHTRMTVIAFASTLIIYSSFAVAGLGLFGSSTMGNVLTNYASAGRSVVVAGWVGTMLSINFSFPLVFSSARASLIGLVPALSRAGKTWPQTSHVAITCGLLSLIAGVACFADNMALVTGLLGATIGSCISWIFPAAIYLSATQHRPWASGFTDPVLDAVAKQGRPLKPKKRLVLLSTGLIVIGLTSMIIGLMNTFGVI